MTLDNMTGITEGSYTGFCKSQLISCNFVKMCNGVCPFEDALKHADKMQAMDVQLADKSPRTVKLTEDIEITLDEEAYEIGYTHGQMADRPKGEWILECDGENECDNLYKCSMCGVEYGCEEYDKPNFCPNCGARMKGGAE